MRVPHSNQPEMPKTTEESISPPKSLAPTLAKILAANPKLMIELAIEVTKLTQQELVQSKSPENAALSNEPMIDDNR